MNMASGAGDAASMGAAIMDSDHPNKNSNHPIERDDEYDRYSMRKGSLSSPPGLNEVLRKHPQKSCLKKAGKEEGSPF